MNPDEVTKMTREMIQAGRPFVLATVDREGLPCIRWMGGGVLDEPLTVWMATGMTTRKVDQIRANPAAQLMYSDERVSRVATISGACEIVEDIEAKRRLWEAMPVLSRFVSGYDDPNLGVIKFVGKRVELINMAEGMSPWVAEL